MSTLDALHRRLKALKDRLKPHLKRLPFVVINAETGADLPGWEAPNQYVRDVLTDPLMGIKEYCFDPDEMDSEEEDEIG